MVLPSHRLVCVTCAAPDARVQSVLDAALAVEQQQHAGVSAAESHTRDVRVFPLAATTVRDTSDTSGWQGTQAAKRWSLVLVRKDLELTPSALARDVLHHMDILELRVAQPVLADSSADAVAKSADKVCDGSNDSDSSASSASSHFATAPHALPLHTTALSYTPQEQQRHVRQRKSATGSSHRGARKRTLRVGGARQTPEETRRCPCSRLIKSIAVAKAPDAPSIADATSTLLRGTMQLLDQLAALEAQVSALLLDVRDAHTRRCSTSANGSMKIADLLPPLLRVARALHQHNSQCSLQRHHQLVQKGRFPIEDFTRDLGRALTDASSEALLSVPVVHQGWVVCGEWGAFWRNQRREFACLCDDGVLRFFSTERACSEYLFALARVRSSAVVTADNTAAKLLEEHAPQTQIDLSDAAGGWSVRRSDADASARHAFALFEHPSKLRLIVDVESERDASAWVTAITAELCQFELLADLQRAWGSTDASTPSEQQGRESGGSATTAPLLATDTAASTTSSRSTTGCDATATKRKSQGKGSCRRFALPLRWLHAQMERLHGRSARYQRLQCASLSQALKDFRRDRIQINGVEFLGTCVDDVLVALTSAILRSLSHDDAVGGGVNSHERAATSVSPPLEMIALRLARELLVCSSRTDGGGDILDALHLVFPTADFSVCPRASESEPITVQLSNATSSSWDLHSSNVSATPSQPTVLPLDPPTPIAEITIRMGYCVIPSASELLSSDQEHSTALDASDPSAVSTDDESGHIKASAPANIQVAAVYYKKLVGDFAKWHQVDGRVEIELRQ